MVLVADRGTLRVEPGPKLPSWTLRKVGKKELEVSFKHNGEPKKVLVYWKHGANLHDLVERAIRSAM